MKLNVKKYLEFGRTLSLKEQNEFAKRANSVILAIEINPELFIEGFETLYKEYPKFKECIED